MPIISTYYGIIIRMYFKDSEQHHKPHFHATYGDAKAVFDLDGNILLENFHQSKQNMLSLGRIFTMTS